MFQTSCIFREDNTVAGSMANLGLSSTYFLVVVCFPTSGDLVTIEGCLLLIICNFGAGMVLFFVATSAQGAWSNFVADILPIHTGVGPISISDQ